MHVRIKAASPDPFPFLNYKQYHSINVQLISDAKYNLLNVVARWPGGAQDFVCKTTQLAFVAWKWMARW